MRQITFRGKRVDNGQWVEGDLMQNYIHHEGYLTIVQSGCIYYKVIPESIGQFTGLRSKSGEDIYEGDELSYKKPYRTTQTHTGDNIPNGSYTEPMEPGIKTIYGEVMFKDGTFYLDSEDDVDYDMPTPISWNNISWDLEMIKDAISWTRQEADWFDDPEEGDLQYLITDCAKVENAEQLIEFLSGFTIEGNIHDNDPELINK